jgi:small-conductance mechanosensitive channel/CRP-like cAMP-binding protein
LPGPLPGGDDGIVQGPTTLLLAAALLLAVTLWRRVLLRRGYAARELVSDLTTQQRAFGLYLFARLLHLALPDLNFTISHALRFVALLFGAIGVIRLLETLLFAMRARFQAPPSRIVRSLIAWSSTLVAAAFILRIEYKVDLSSLFATSALLSVVLVFALQESLGNLFAGLTLNAEQPFEAGEWVSFGKYTGKVVDVGWRSTRLITSDEDEILVPNGLISREVVVNHMRPQLTDAVELTVAVDLDVSPARAKAVLREAVEGCELALKTPAPLVQLASFTDNGVAYRIKFHTDGFQARSRALDQVQEALWYGLRRAAVEMPYPQTTISFRERAAEAEERRRREHLAEAEDLLGRVDFVQALSAGARRVLAQRARFVEYGPGQAVVRQGESGDTLYLVARGEVAVKVQVEDATERELARLGRGALFGEMSVLTGEPRTATVVALGDAALLSVDRDAFERVLFAEPHLAQALAATIARRRQALDAARAQPVAPVAEETIDLVSRIRSIFGFQKRAVGD